MIKLLQGDCLERMAEIPDGSIDMILADPPYGTTGCKWDRIIPFEPMWEHIKRVTKPDGAIVMTTSQPFTTALIASNMKMFKYEWIWKKNAPTGMALSNIRPMKYHENILVFYSQQPTYNKQPTKREWKGELPRAYKRRSHPDKHGFNKSIGDFKLHDLENKNPSSVLIFDIVSHSKGTLHPTQKPAPLMEYLIRTYTNEGDTVLDFAMGSGTTGVACKRLNRSFIGIELDAHYFEIAKNRIASTGEPLFVLK